MKFYKDENNQLWAYEDDMPEFSSYSEVEQVDETGNVTTVKIYPEFTVKEGLTAITKEYADELVAKKQAEIDANMARVVPQSLSRFQALTILDLTDIDVNGETITLYDATDDYINYLDKSTTENKVIKMAWSTATEFQRDSATILALQKAFNLTDEQIDKIFIDGSKITS